MIKTVTQPDLLRYLYAECPPAEAAFIQAAIEADPTLQLDAEALLEGMQVVDAALQTAPEKAVYNLLRYSRNTAAPAQYM